MEFKDHLKSSIDIVQVIGDYIRLRRMGSNGRYKGLCPFHQEKTPSFNVDGTNQFYKCFGCGVAGDVFTFVMQHDGMTFPEAMKYLAERAGIPMPQRGEYSDTASRLKGALHEMHEIAADLYRSNLRGEQGAEAVEYLKRRGLTGELAATFGLGFSEATGQALTRRLTDRGFTPEQLEASGLVRKSDRGPGYYDYFRGRLMFPIHNESGKVIGFGGRAMRDEDQPKYLNSPETPIYHKTSVLYNLHRARDGMRRNGRVVLVEGYMDVIGVHAAGIKESVASCGTALTGHQVRAMHRHADTVIVNFDPDTAGTNAAEKAIQILLDEGMHVKVLTLDQGLDPDEYVKQFGADAYVAALDQASGYFHWLADRARTRFNMRTPEGRVDAFKFLLPAVQKLPDHLERAAVAEDLAGYLGVDKSMVLDELKRAAVSRKAPEIRRTAPQAALPAAERILLHVLLRHAEIREEILGQLTPPVVQTLVGREIFEAFRRALNGQTASSNGRAGDGSRPDARGDAFDGEERADPVLEHQEDYPEQPDSGAGTARLFAELDGRLSESGRQLLHQAVSADDTGESDDESEAVSRARASMRRIVGDFAKRRVGELKRRITDAARDGDVAEALKLNAELAQLERDSLASGDVE